MLAHPALQRRYHPSCCAVCVAFAVPVQAMYGARKWRTMAVVSILQAFQQQKTNPYQQVVILVQVSSLDWVLLCWRC